VDFLFNIHIDFLLFTAFRKVTGWNADVMSSIIA